MKILKIEFKNINSLKGSHSIDFTAAPFTVSSLFAITGPTGSGKSTILDVISLALFNQVPRLGKITKNEILSKGAILTRNQKEASAKVTYQSQHGTFASQWSISTNRNDKLRDYEMELVDLSTEKPLDLKKSDVPARNEELIGLNYDQFIKSVLLAQGEFAQFLRARKDERGELLEKITGTGIYRQVGIKAFQKFKEVNAELLDRQREIELIQRDLLPEDDLKKLTNDLRENQGNCDPLEKAIRELDQNLQLKKTITEQEEQINRTRRQKETAETALANFEAEHGQPLKQHERLQVFAADIRTWSSLKNTCTDLGEELQENRKKAETNQLGLKDCFEKIQQFIQEKCKEEDAAKALQHFSENIRNLQQEKNEKGSRYRELTEKFQIRSAELPFQINGNLQESFEKLQELDLATQKKISHIEEELEGIDLKSPEKEKHRLQKDLENTRKAGRQAEKLQHISKEIDRITSEEEKLKPKLKELPEKIEKAEAQVTIFRERQEKLDLKRQNQILKASLEEHRTNLRAGEPCPLCGSPEHPYAEEHREQEDELTEAIRQTEKELAEWSSQLSGHRTGLKLYEERTLEFAASKKRLQEELKSSKQLFREEFGHFTSGEQTDWEKLCSGQQEQIDSLDRYEKESRKLTAIHDGLPIIEELKKVLLEGKTLKEKLDSLYPGNNINTDTHELQTRWTKLGQDKKALAQLGKDLELKVTNRTGELSKLEEGLLPWLRDEGCESIMEAVKMLLPETEAAGLRKRREQLLAETANLNASLTTLTSQLETWKRKDVEKTAEELSTDLLGKKKELEVLRSRCEELRRSLNNDQDRRQRLEQIGSQIAEKEKHIKRWRLLNELIGDATGKKFNDFAQDLSLTQLLYLANIRLGDLSDRYQIDKPSSGEDDSLVAIDEHMGGQRRSVRTLSGGETFILSLSMALALSDLASKNVEINSLFIDEGFGTLDPETLDQTLDTLEKLQAESSKTIGIISHVDSLKERIATQVKLTRNGQGYSSLEIGG